MRTFREKHGSTLKLLTTANDRRTVRTYIEFYHRKLSTGAFNGAYRYEQTTRTEGIGSRHAN